MKIKQLIKELQKIEDQESLVLLSSDASGHYIVEADCHILDKVYVKYGLAWDSEYLDTCYTENFRKSVSPAIILFPLSYNNTRSKEKNHEGKKTNRRIAKIRS